MNFAFIWPWIETGPTARRHRNGQKAAKRAPGAKDAENVRNLIKQLRATATK
jgi:hypothetical protein